MRPLQDQSSRASGAARAHARAVVHRGVEVAMRHVARKIRDVSDR